MPSRKFCPRPQPVRTSRDLSLGFCPPEKYALEYASIPQISLFGAYATPQNQLYNGPRTDKSRLVPADIHHPKNMPKNACPNPQISPNGAYAYPQILPETTARTDKSRLVLADYAFTRKICPRRCPKHAIIQYSLPKIPPR
jgi:hypothetical protein